MKKRVALLVDQKWRDLPSIVWLKLQLEKSGVEARMFPFGSEQAFMPGFRPHVAVFNNCQDEARQSFCRRLSQQGTKIVILPTEGIPTLSWQLDDWAGISSDWSVLDKYLAWNDIISGRIIEVGSMPANQVRALGIPRFDFYRDPLRKSHMQKQDYCKKFGLNPDCPTILWPTNFTLAGFENRNQELWKSIYKAMHWDIAYPDLSAGDIPRIDGDTRRMTRDALLALREEFPDANLAIKPHPNEDVIFWREFIAEAEGLPGKGKLALIWGVYIWDALSCADVVIQRSCTTAPEAWFLGIASIEAKFNKDDFYYSADHASGSEEVENVPDLISLVRAYLHEGREVPEAQKEAQKIFEKKWCTVVDGRRTQEAVKEIMSLTDEAPDEISRPIPHPRYVSQFLKAAIKRAMGHRAHELLTWEYIFHLKKKPEGADILGRVDKYVDSEDIELWEEKLGKFI